MKKMKIKFLADWKHQGVQYEKDDVTSFNEVTGKFFCKAGVGEDVSGEVKTEKPHGNESITLDIQSIKQVEGLTDA